ncbi:nucleotidyltransferase domain-containing protein [Bifidobacterium sp. SO1]|uniref:nucleotidyltransferase domain-containing protein n=1 Tax=Bifidobacterium sp. SO1 TaxID=2809029 RepID=UPI001BDC1DA6|nr:nucleotidyltransferase domain-containing protein [Bifidobacterium sp. SO1]MBT1162805.1 nucleotidyltransferase domain-containing protein [Bifidobacterium sp. SO1]
MSIDIESYRRQLEPFADLDVVSAWVAGSHMHGLADDRSDVDVKLIVAPDASDILLQKSDWVRSFHSPDVTVMTPIPFMGQLLKGSPNTVEALTADPMLVLVDHGLLTAFRPIASRLVTGATVDMALGNARANMHMLDRRTDLDDRRRRKLVAETMRLLQNVEQTCMTGGAWPAMIPANLRMLRGIRDGGITVPGLGREYERVAALSAARWPAPLNGETRETVESVFVDLIRRIVEGCQESTPIDELVGLLDEWMGRSRI